MYYAVAPNFTPPLVACAISPLAGLRQAIQAPLSSLHATRRRQYTVVLVDGSGAQANAAESLGQGPLGLYFSSPGQMPLAEVPAQAQGQVLRFTDEFMSLTGDDQDLLLFDLFHRPGAGGPLVVPGEQAAEITFLLNSIQRQMAGTAKLGEALQRSYLKTLLLCCLHLSQQPSADGRLVQPGLFLRFRKLLEEHYIVWKSVADYADQLHVTAGYLSTVIKKETGRPASDHIRQRIIQEAQRLISRGDMRLKEVAYQLGFDDASYFSRLFKRGTGMTFSRFKASSWLPYHAPSASEQRSPTGRRYYSGPTHSADALEFEPIFH